MNNRAGLLGLAIQTPANINVLGQQLWQNPEPNEKERKMWRLLKEARRHQAEWRAREREKLRSKIINPDGLSSSVIRKATGLWVDLKERKCSYGDYVFNLALPDREERYPSPIKIPSNLSKTIWALAREIEQSWPLDLKMMRVDAIRQADNTIKVIELNPCWVDNIAALQAFYETYRLPFPRGQGPIEIFAKEIAQKESFPSGSNLALVYCERTYGCKKDEIYGLSDYLWATGLFQSIAVAPLHEVGQNEDGTILVRGIPVGTLYLNGSFIMAGEFIREQAAIQKIKRAQEKGLLSLAPAQFIELDRKTSLVELSRRRPDLFVRTEVSPFGLPFPVIAKTTRSESLSGVKIIDKGELNRFDPQEKLVFQPMTTYQNSGIICFDSKTKTSTRPPFVYEKINLWIIENRVVGVLATYSPQPLISDSGYNLPIGWEER